MRKVCRLATLCTAISACAYDPSASGEAELVPGVPSAASEDTATGLATVTAATGCPAIVDIPKPQVLAGFTYYHDVPIGNGGTCQLTIDIVAPATDPGRTLPAVVYVHGGGWNHGDKNEHAASIAGYPRKGYIGVAVNYRLTPGNNVFPAQIEDVKLAIRYLRANAGRYFLDPSRIGVWGASAGGHLAALLGTSAGQASLEGSGGWPGVSSAVQCVVDHYGPADFTTEFANSWNSVTALLGGHAFDVPQQARSAMPGTYATAAAPPFFIVHGDADTTVPCTDSTTLARQLRAVGANVVHGLASGAGHSLSPVPWVSPATWAFLDHCLRGIGPQPPATPVGSLTPIAWWKLDEAAASTDASDSSAAYPGVALAHRNAAQQLPELGRVGGALRFRDGYSYLSNKDINTTAQVRALNFTTAMSVEAWVKLETLPKDYVPSITDVKLVYRVNSTSKSGYELFVSGADNKPRFKIWQSSTSRVEVAATTALTANAWFHVVGTYDGTHLNIYVNGQPSTPQPWSSGIGSPGDTDIKLGGTTTTTTNPRTGIIGWLDEVRLYDRALTGEEVTAQSSIP